MKPLPVGRIPKLQIVVYIVANGSIARIEKLVDSPAGATAIVENSRVLWDFNAFGLTEGDLTKICMETGLDISLARILILLTTWGVFDRTGGSSLRQTSCNIDMPYCRCNLRHRASHSFHQVVDD